MKKYTAILATLLVGAVSCNPLDILNTKPEATLDKETFFKQEDNLRLYSDAFYGVYNDIDEFYEQQTDHFVNKDLSAQMRGTNSRQVPATGGGWSYSTVQEDGFARWYHVGGAAGQTMTVQVPENGSFWVYDGNGQVTASSVLWDDTSATLPQGGFIVFAGDAGVRFHLCFQ